jgi:hypothetical protein
VQCQHERLSTQVLREAEVLTGIPLVVVLARVETRHELGAVLVGRTRLLRIGTIRLHGAGATRTARIEVVAKRRPTRALGPFDLSAAGRVFVRANRPSRILPSPTRRYIGTAAATGPHIVVGTRARDHPQDRHPDQALHSVQRTRNARRTHPGRVAYTLLHVSTHEIRASWVLATRRFVQEEQPSAREALTRYLPEEYSRVFDDALPGNWYPEEVLSGVLLGLHEVMAEGDAEKFEALLERGVTLGIHRFFSAMLKLSSPRFVLARVPTLWNLSRRGPAHVEVERHPEGSLVCYRDFPYFGLERYRLLTRASIRVLLRQTGIETPCVEIVEATDTRCYVLGRHD